MKITNENTKTPTDGQILKLPSGNIVVARGKITEGIVPCIYLKGDSGGVAFTAEFLRGNGVEWM